MAPMLALQSFVGPLIAHLLLRPFVQQTPGETISLESAVTQLADVWVAGMRP